MSVIAVVIVNSENHPIYIRIKYDYDKKKISEEENMTILYNINAALDIIDEKQNNSQSRDTYLGNYSFVFILFFNFNFIHLCLSGLLNQCENYKIYGFLSPTKVKILLMVSTNINVMFR